MNLPYPENKNLPEDFVYLHQIDPTILTDLKCFTHHNFVGRPLPGYEANVVILTEAAALALKARPSQHDANGFGWVDTFNL